MMRSLRSESGAAAVELGLILPLLAMLLLGTIEFGRLFNAQLALQHATREGVRVLAVTKDSAEAISATTTAATPSGITPTVTTTACTHGSQTSVTAEYEFDFLMPMFGTTKMLSATGVMRCGG